MDKEQWKIIAAIAITIALVSITLLVGIVWIGYDEYTKELKCKAKCEASKAEAFDFRYGLCTCLVDNKPIKYYEI